MIDPKMFWREVAAEAYRRELAATAAEGDTIEGALRLLLAGSAPVIPMAHALALLQQAIEACLRGFAACARPDAVLQNLPRPPAGASKEAAAGAAAAIVLARLFARQAAFVQRRQVEWIDGLCAEGQSGHSVAEGADWGMEVGMAVLASERSPSAPARVAGAVPGAGRLEPSASLVARGLSGRERSNAV